MDLNPDQRIPETRIQGILNWGKSEGLNLSFLRVATTRKMLGTTFDHQQIKASRRLKFTTVSGGVGENKWIRLFRSFEIPQKT